MSEARQDDKNFPDKTEYGRFWSQELNHAKTALAASTERNTK